MGFKRSKLKTALIKATTATLAKRMANPTKALTMRLRAASTRALSPPAVSQLTPPQRRKMRTARPPTIMRVRQRVAMSCPRMVAEPAAVPVPLQPPKSPMAGLQSWAMRLGWSIVIRVEFMILECW